MIEKKIHLGDGAYAAFDGYGFVITAENGINATDTVYVEPPALKELVRFAKMHGVDTT